MGDPILWVIMKHYRDPEDYGIPHAPTNTGDDGEPFMTAENPMPVRR